MSATNLTDLVDALDSELDRGTRLADVDDVVEAIRAAIPRYEAALALAEMLVGRADALDRLVKVPAGHDKAEGDDFRMAEGVFRAALAAYREARS